MAISEPTLDVTDAQTRAAGVVFRRGLGLVLATLLVPGAAQLQAGNRSVGRIAIKVWLGLVAMVALTAVLALVWRGPVVALLASGWFYKLLQPLLILAGLAHAALLVDAWRLARPLSMERRRRLGFGVGSLVLAGVVLISSINLGSAARAQGDLLDRLLGGGGVSEAQAGRYNILMLGVDAGADRVGLRPDSIMVASVSEQTGRAVMFSLPRNLEGAKFPEGSPLRDLYPNGYECADHSCMLNAIYTLGQEHKDLYPGVKDPGLQAMREVVGELLGLTINYTVVVDLWGFVKVIDAVGGIRLNVNKRVPIGGGTSKIYGYIEPGRNKHLDGYHALWFARSRHGSSDYERMLRQKCVVNAMLQQLDPLTVLTKFNQIAAAGEQVAFTDVPSKDVNKLATLATRTRSLPMSSVSFTPPLIYPGNPKLNVIRDTVRAKIEASEALDAGTKPAAATKRASKPTNTSPAVAKPSTPVTSPASKASRSTPSATADDNGTPAPTNDDLGQVCSL